MGFNLVALQARLVKQLLSCEDFICQHRVEYKQRVEYKHRVEYKQRLLTVFLKSVANVPRAVRCQ